LAPEPDHSPWGERLRERTQPLQPDDDQYGWAHAILCETLAQPFLQVAELADPEDPLPPWAPLFSVDLCPAWALPWLAQLVGARLPVGISEDDARTYILEVAGHRAGTSASMTTAVRNTLVPSDPDEPATVWFRERDGSPYRLEVVTLTGETPDPAASLRALLAFKPGGILLEYRQVDGWDYQQMTTEGGTYAQQTTTYTSYRNLREHQSG
jgi:hypothetical protein